MIARFKLLVILIVFEVASSFILSRLPSGDYLQFTILSEKFSISPVIYFYIAGAFSFAIIPLIAEVGKDQLAIDILGLALIMLVFQFVGLIIYHFDLHADLYQWPIHGLVLAQFLRLLIVREKDGVDQYNNFLHLLCRADFKRGGNLC
jgi:hypothetical protein